MDNRRKLRFYALIITTLCGIVFLITGFCIDKNVSQIFSQISLAMATALLAAAILGFLKLDDISTIEETLETHTEMNKRGVRKIGSPTHYDDEIKEKLREVRKGQKIQVMLHSGKTFLSTFKPDIMKAIEHGCHIEILIASPEVSVDDQEILLKNLCGGTSRAEIERFKGDFNAILDEVEKSRPDNIACYESKINVKQYNFAPTGNILVIGDYVRFIPYLSNKNSSNSIAIIGQMNIGKEGRFNIFKEIFDEIYKEIAKEEDILISNKRI